MIYYRTIMAVVLFTAMAAFSSCEDKTTTTSTEEQTRITTMDSTAKVVSEQKEKLEEQTKKVEESLEKLDNEFDSTKN
jgi:septal ring factor EnvC (AmiA/AmiB activator)